MNQDSDWIMAVVRVLGATEAPGTSGLEQVATHFADETVDHTQEQRIVRRREILAGLPFEADTFAALYKMPRQEFEGRLARWCVSLLDSPAALNGKPELIAELGSLGVLLLSVSTLEHADRHRFEDIADPMEPRPGDDAPATDRPAHEASVATRLSRSRAVTSALRDLYRPVLTEEQASRLDQWSKRPEQWREKATPDERAEIIAIKEAADAAQFWNGLDFRSLTFHEFGTTSFICRAHLSGSGTGAEIALKFVLLPYARLPVIAAATSSYRRDYENAELATSAVTVLSSSTNWIAMDFVRGDTLGTLIRRHDQARPSDSSSRGRPVDDRATLLLTIAPLLFEALADIGKHKLVHADLNPSNIIVEELGGGGAKYRLTMIDFGRNYLYGQSGLGRQSSDARYIAPEVRSDDEPSWRADLYSLGQLLIGLSGAGRDADGIVPDAFYLRTCHLARFLEDLLQEDPAKRLLLYPPTGDAPVRGDAPVMSPTDWSKLSTTFVDEVAAERAADRTDGLFGPPSRSRRFVLDFAPSSGTPRRLARLLREISRPQALDQPTRRAEVTSLLWWSWASTAAWYVTVAVTGYLLLRDLDLISGGPLEDYHARIRASGYHLPPGHLQDNLPARIALFSIAWAAVKYYQNIYAGLSTASAADLPGRFGAIRRATEFFVRLNAIFVLLVAIPLNILNPSWWATAATIALVDSLLVNLFGRVYCTTAVRRGQAPDERGRPTISTIPQRIVGLEMYRPWTPSMLAYVLICLGFSLLINFHVLKDVIAYASVVAVVNIGLLTFTKCGTNADILRVGITRAFLAAERLSKLPAAAVELPLSDRRPPTDRSHPLRRRTRVSTS
ncbi:protein kinase domain-containing protein [Actinoplanes cyaneus]|uniref:protein kinase domain-containing protein n=1 Tax=Actinoplanes cyaneus TaxID=52696 RepID=UPI0022276797|nr:hypothetical protein [Actinoplanes cyaneus]